MEILTAVLFLLAFFFFFSPGPEKKIKMNGEVRKNGVEGMKKKKRRYSRFTRSMALDNFLHSPTKKPTPTERYKLRRYPERRLMRRGVQKNAKQWY